MKRRILSVFLLVLMLFPNLIVLGGEEADNVEHEVEITRELLLDDELIVFNSTEKINPSIDLSSLIESDELLELDIEEGSLQFLGFLVKGEILESYSFEELEEAGFNLRLSYRASSRELETPTFIALEGGVRSYEALPLEGGARSFARSSSTREVEVVTINSSGSWAFYHAWDTTQPPVMGITSTFAYFRLDDGSIGFCLDPTKKGPGGSLPVEAFASSSFRSLAEKVSTLAVASGGLDGYSFEENFVFAQMYIWQNIPHSDGSGQRYQVDFRYQSSPFDRHEETHARYMAWKSELDSKMASLGRVSFDGEDFKLKIGEEKRISDSNGNLKNYSIKGSIDGLELRVDGNSLVVKANKPLKGNLELWQAKTSYPLPEVSFVLKGHDDSYQDLGVFRDPYVAKISFSAVEENARVRIIKKSTDDKFIGGAVFELSATRDFKTILESFETGSDGKALSKELPLELERVFVREKSVPHPYRKSEEIKEVLLEAGKVHEVSFTNDYKPASVRLTKKSTDDKFIEGAVFELSATRDFKTILESFETGSDGKALSKELPLELERVFVREKSVPHPYKKSEEIKEVVLEAGKVHEVSFINDYKPASMRIVKHSQDGEPIEGAVFEVASDDGFKDVLAVLTSLENGQISLGDIDVLEYPQLYVREISVPEPYILEDHREKLVLKPGQEVEKVFINETKRVVLEKSDLATGGPVPGAIIEITSWDGTVSEYETDSTGKVSIKDIISGDYSFREILAPQGYILNPSSFNFTVHPDGRVDGVTEFENEPVSLKIQKLDEESNYLEGAGFAVIFDSGDLKGERLRATRQGSTYIASLEGEEEVFYSDGSGPIQIDYLPQGDYLLVEIQAPAGYVLDDKPRSFSVGKSGILEGDFSYVNRPTLVELSKKDLVTGEGVEGALIVLKDKEAREYEFITDKNGQVIISHLLPGVYEFREKLAPEGYILNENSFKFELRADGTIDGIREFTNEPTRLKIIKKDRGDLTPLEGVGFKIFFSESGETLRASYDKDLGNYRAKSSGEEILYTNEKGELVIDYLPKGDYLVLEVDPAKGYILHDDLSKRSLEITIDDESGLLVEGYELLNDKTRVLISKKDSLSDKALEGAEIRVWKKGFNRIFTSDERGQILLEGLEPGSYRFKEKRQPEGYTLNRTSYIFNLSANGQVSGISELKNEPTRLIIRKVDGDKNPLAGVEFKLKDKKGKPLRSSLEDGVYIAHDQGDKTSLISDEDGLITIDYLPQGSYLIEEVTPPEGYSPSRNRRIKIKDHGVDSPLEVDIINRKALPETGSRGGRSLVFALVFLFLAVLTRIRLKRS